MAYREDLFTHTINQLNGGKVSSELSEKLNTLVNQCRDTCNKGSIQLTIEINPDKAGSGQYILKDSVKVSEPKFPRATTFLWGTPEGNLQSHNPDQGNLELKVMPDTQQVVKKIEENTAPIKTVANN